MLKTNVNICGIPHEIILCEDNFDVDTHFAQINYGNAEIKVNKNMNKYIQEESICHEVVHGILVHIGRQELSSDETFVQALGNAIMQSFEIKLSYIGDVE